MKFTSSVALCVFSALGAAPAAAQTFTGSGQIHVLNSSDWSTATPADSIGCLDASGAFSLSDCATFTKLEAHFNTLSSSIGNCTFSDSTQPANTDNPYGAHSYSWHCLEDYVATVSDSLYTITGFNYPFLCHGDVSCFYDVKTIPADGETSPVWQYVWGSQQTTIPAGHTQVLWLWQQVE